MWMAPVARVMAPSRNSSSFGAGVRTCTWALPERKGPIWEAGSAATASVVPWAMTCPPWAPAWGPISMSQSASFRIWVSWSTSSTELPSATRSSITRVRPVMFWGVQADGGLVQHVEHPGGAVAHRPGQLHPLALPGGEGGGRPVQCQVPQAQLHQPPGRQLEGLADALRHGAHLLRQEGGHTLYPPGQLGEGHPAGLVQADAPEFGGRAAGLKRVPPQSGHRSSFRNFSTRFMPFSSFTLERAFSTVYTAL